MTGGDGFGEKPFVCSSVVRRRAVHTERWEGIVVDQNAVSGAGDDDLASVGLVAVKEQWLEAAVRVSPDVGFERDQVGREAGVVRVPGWWLCS